MPEILKIDINHSDEAVFQKAAEILASGGVIAYPTETFYGLGVDATNENAIRKIFEIKGRNFNNPISVIIGSKENIYQLVKEIPATAIKLMEAFWPGPLTIVFQASGKVSPLLTADTNKIGIRISGNRGATAIVQKLGRPLTATSANLSGAPECTSAMEVNHQIGNKIDAIIDLGETPGGKGSTIIDTSSEQPQILREGVISRLNIQDHVNIK